MSSLGIYLGFLAILLLLRRVLGTFWGSAAFVAATAYYLESGFQPILPGSVKILYLGVTILAVLLYITSSDNGWSEFMRPIQAIAADPGKSKIKWLVLLVVPLLVAWQAHQMSLPSPVPPPKVRSVHPSPPSTVSTLSPGELEASVTDLINGDNPYRALEKSDPEAYAKHLARGRVVYYENCYYCHGDTLAADGHYAEALKPPPANFQDPGTIAMLQEAYLFWRIAKGGPGLPDAATPWDSSMPAWEKMMSEDDMWDVILFLYDYVGYVPRTREGGH